jgi:hypothetical protein
LKLPQNVHPGQTAWRVFPDDPNKEQLETLDALTNLINDRTHKPNNKNKNGSNGRSASTARTPYQRYVEKYEITISPEHSFLQSAFCDYLKTHHFNVEEDIKHVDVRYRDETGRMILSEVKPCTRKSARYAIRTAIGQLLDYKQRLDGKARLLVVTQVKR